MSRQRMRAGVLEGSSETCAHCNGSGMVRSVESRALHVLRQIDENAGKFTEGELIVHLPQDVAIYLLNNKRAQLHEIEARAGIAIAVEIDIELNAMEMAITLPDHSDAGGVSRMEGDPAAVAEDNGSKRRRRRRGGRNRRRGANTENGDYHSGNENDGEDSHEMDMDADGTSVEALEITADDENGDEEDKPKRRRRRGRRGGRNRRRGQSGADDADQGATQETLAESGREAAAEQAPTEKIVIEVSRNDDDNETEKTPSDTAEEETADEASNDEKKPRRSGWWRK